MKMFKSAFVAAALVASFAVSMPANAADTGNIAVIRSNDLVQQSPQYTAAQEKMKAEFERRGNDLQAEFKKFGEDVDSFKKEAELLSATDRARKEKDLNTRQIDLQYKKKQFEEDSSNRQRQLFADMMAQFKTVIEQVAKEKGAIVVIENPVYSTPDIDITDEVLKRLQAQKKK